MRALRLWVWVLAAVLVHGCAGMGGERPDGGAPVEDREGAAAAEGAGAEGAEGAAAAGAEMGGEFAGSPLDDPDSPLSTRVVYFEFDSSEVRAEDRELLATHAGYLADHPEVSVVLEGHTDERGSREYNLALGERRAKAVQRILVLNGAAQDQLQVVSFGEERPVATGHDESAWSLNRRVELIYSGY